jgi:hypothetical protein
MSSRLLAVVAGWLLTAVCAALAPAVASASEPHFGVSKFTFSAIANESGEARPSSPAPFTQAGGHPYEVRSLIELNTEIDSVTGEPFPVQEARDFAVDLPAGLVGDPLATPRCALLTFIAKECKGSSQVGSFVILRQGRKELEEGEVYNLVPTHGHPAEFGFVNRTGLVFALTAGVRTGEGYGIRVEDARAPLGVRLEKVELDMWGVPADPRHDPYRGRLCDEFAYEHKLRCAGHEGGEPDTNPEVPFLTMPTDCGGGPLSASVSVDSWEEPAAFFPAGVQPTVQEHAMPAVTGCDVLAFEPSLKVVPESGGSSFTTGAGEPVGLHVHLDLPQIESPERAATPQVKDVTVALPVGMVVSPSSANGLVACSDAQFELRSAGPGVCPPASQVGTVKIATPELTLPLEGDVYLAEPRCGPCTPADAQGGRMVRLFVQALSTDQSGVVLKLEGNGSIDQQTGQIVTSFKENPQLPFSEFELSMSGGPRATLANPRACGPAKTVADLTPWSAPFTPDAALSSEYEVSGCLGSQFAPSFTAGTTSNQAGGFSPFTLSFGRSDADGFLDGVQLKMPPGLLGMLSSVSLCGEPQAAEGTCGPGSLIGHTQVLTGPGAEPFLVTGGQVFITGPYKGAPYGLSIVVPAKAGPYTLSGTTGKGTVVVRAAINVDPATAALTVTADPLPTKLDGIPLQLRVVNVTIDRPGFTFNPTSCDSTAIAGTLSSTQGQSAQVSAPFQVTNCAALAFKPQFKVSTSGKTSKVNGASLDAMVSFPASSQGSQANIARVKVDLPKQLPSRLTTLQKACLAAVFEANPANCPAASVVGIARAVTPVLTGTLAGPVYFVSHGGEAFPSLVVILQGDGVRVDLTGATFISKAGITSSTFKTVPDVPISSFELYLPEGKFSALAANGNLCALTSTVTVKRKVTQRVHGRTVQRTITTHVKKPASLLMPTEFVAQNGAVIHSSTPIAVTGCAKAKNAKASRAGKKQKAAGSAGHVSHASTHGGGRS